MRLHSKFPIITSLSWVVIMLYAIQVYCVHPEADEITKMEPINGTKNFRIYGEKFSDDKPWFDGRNDIRHIHCVRPGKCEELTFSTCLGSKIPYSHTSFDLTDSSSQNQIQEILHSYQALKHVPKCWAVVQPLICAVFAPKCAKIENKDMVYLPSLEMCKLTLEPCRVLYNTSYFPEFLRCNETLFPSKCNNDVREMKFNVTGKCLEPLVPAESSSSYYTGIEGCGLQCKDPLYTDDEHRQIHKLVGWGSTLCILSNLFVIATFFIDWQNANKYPALIVFYINLCFLISYLGWIAQFTPEGREDIVCRKDGTLRHSEPSASENLSCIVVFVLVYYFLLAAMIWFVFLTYAWHLKAVGNGSVQDRINKKGSYFHLVAWSLPLVLTISAMAQSEVDGNSTVGVCFVGYVNHPIRAGLLLGPLCGVLLMAGFFIMRGMIRLFVLKKFANGSKSASASDSRKIHWIIVRMGICAILTFVFIVVTIMCHINEFINTAGWSDSLRKYIICKISATYTDDDKICKIENRPSVAMMQLRLLCLFGSGIVMSSWCWTPSSIETWRRYIRKKCGRDVNEIKMQKHKVIAQAWAKRKEFDDKGRLSITLYNTIDPVGLNYDVNDLNSSATNEISSTWVNCLPQFVKRRFALTGAATNSSSHGPRKSSVDSEISVCFRHVSVESRRNSVDSQMSLKIAEVKTQVASRSRSGGHHHAKHTKNRNRKRNVFRNFNNRRESSTSVESQVIAMKKTTYSGNNQKVDIFAQSAKNMKRRSASAGLVETDDISNFLPRNFPFFPSDEETSRASYKIQDSRLDVVVRQRDLSDDDSNDNCEVDEYHSDGGGSIKKQRKLEDYLNDIQTSSSFDNIIVRNSKDRFDSASRNSKNSMKSRKSNKRRQSLRRNNRKCITSKSTKKDADNTISDNNASCTSLSVSELDLPIATQSSYSGMSCGKTQSRNSKTSCDVGIQTNANEIATQTMSTYNDEVANDSSAKISKRQGNYRNSKNRRKSETLYRKDHDSDDEMMMTECNQLLPLKPKVSIVNYNNMSESERLQKLLLPE